MIDLVEIARVLHKHNKHFSIEFWSHGEIQVWYREKFGPYLTHEELEDYLCELAKHEEILFKQF